MFKNLIVALFAVLVMSVPAMAADLFTLNGLNVSGDTLYLPSSGSFAVGIGSDIATIKEVLTVRGVLVSEVTKDQDNKAGLGIGLNLAKLINMVGGSWLAGNLNASIGATALINLDGDAHVEPALYVSLINWRY